jgi:hypothetical protein
LEDRASDARTEPPALQRADVAVVELQDASVLGRVLDRLVVVWYRPAKTTRQTAPLAESDVMSVK